MIDLTTINYICIVVLFAVGTVMGAVLGLLSGFINADGLLQGARVGAFTGVLVSIELADYLLRIWTSDGCSMDARIKRTVRTPTKLTRKSQ